MACHFCFNAHVWAKEPKTEEDKKKKIIIGFITP